MGTYASWTVTMTSKHMETTETGALLCPRDFTAYTPDVSLTNRRLPGPLAEQYPLLNVGRQEQEIHHLGESGAADVAEPCQIRVVTDFAMVHHRLELDGQRHQARDPGDTRGRRNPGILRARVRATLSPNSNLNIYCIHRFLTFRRVACCRPT